ncbi:MAG TPA: MFS transporter [Chthonomonadaceae bacterium]|nr:MFS transporter [Chthonomonadaceae bacterium]
MEEAATGQAVTWRAAEMHAPWQIPFYFGILTMALGLGRTDALGLAQLPIQHFLQNRFHLDAVGMATFGFLASIPYYASFLFGYLRDRWQPFRMGDRGYLLLATPIAVGGYLWLARSALTYERMLGIVLLTAFAFQFLFAGTQGMLAMVGQRRQMTGRLGAMWMFAAALPGTVAGLGGGWLAAHVSMQGTFAVLAGITTALLVPVFWRPAAVFSGEAPARVPGGETGLMALRRLARHRPYWLAAGVLLCWNLVPGWFTPLYVFLSTKVKMQPEQIGLFNALMAGFNGVAIIGYSFLCRRVPLRPLLWIGTVFGIIPEFLLMIMRTPGMAIGLGVLIGLLNGIPNAAFMDLLLRCCPRKLEGTGTALILSIAVVGVAVSDLFGAWLYQHGGYILAFGVSGLCTSGAFLFLPFLPRHLIARRDGEDASALEGTAA